MINPIFPKNPIGKIAVSLPRNQMTSLVTGLFHIPRKLVPFRSFMMSLMWNLNLCFRLVLKVRLKKSDHEGKNESC